MTKTKMKLYIATWLLAILYVSQSRSTLTVLSAVDESRLKFFLLEEQLWSSVVDEQSNKITLKITENILRDLCKFTDELQKKIPTHILDSLRPLDNARFWYRPYSEMRALNTLYDNFRKMITSENIVSHQKHQWLDFSKTILTDYSSIKYMKSTVPTAMNSINQIIENGLFTRILQKIVFDTCDIGQSNDQLLYNVYNFIAFTQLKGYMMIQFAYMIQQIFEEGNKVHDAHNMRKTYKTAANLTLNAVKNAMTQTKREILKCDPKQHVLDETYTELTQLLQGYLENEVDMNPRSNCVQNCAYYEFTTSMGCFAGICNKQRKCRGKVLKCQYIASDMSVCMAAPKSGRRYEYIEYENDRVFGRNTGCNQGVTKVDSWWRWIFWHCSYCICLCDDNSPESDRYFSLKEVTSDITNNKVITGIRFKKVNQIIHMQIKESKLQPYARVNETVNSWQPIASFKITDSNVHERKDYHMMTWEAREMDLDDLEVPDGYLVTGVAFHVIGSHLNLKIRASPFNFTTGFLKQPNIKSYWDSSESTLSRSQLKLNNPDIPTRSLLQSTVDSKTDQYFQFSNSDLERDVGQTTIPFIDIQPVESDVPVPLSGIGIYHKGQPNFGGFVGPKIFTYNYSKHIKVVTPSD